MNKNIYDFMTKKQNLLPLLFLIVFILIVLTSTTFLKKDEYNFSPECGNNICETEETKQTCPLDCSWPAFDNKTKALWVYENAQESTIDTIMSIGTNTVLGRSGEFNVFSFNFSKYNETSMPPSFTRYSNWSVIKGYKYFIITTWDYNVSAHGNTFEKAVLANGVELDEISPWDVNYWNNFTEIFMRVARYAKNNSNNSKIDGFMFDFELYSIGGGVYWNSSWGFEDSVWLRYLNNRSIPDPGVPRNQRYNWLNTNNRLNDYYLFLHATIKYLAQDMKLKVQAEDPSLIIGAYPGPKGRAYLDDIYAGWSYPDSPTIVWATDSYGGGGAQYIPKTINNSVLVNNKYFNLTTTYNQSVYGYYESGMLLRTYTYQQADLITQAANISNGYWLFHSGMLFPTITCENLIGVYNWSRLPTNCESDSRNPGCCINNYRFPDQLWVNECCPFYNQTIKKMLQAINTTNHWLDLIKLFGTIPQCADLIDNNGNGLIDLDDPGCTSESDLLEYISCVDLDEDGYGVWPSNGSYNGCRYNETDCEDSNPNINYGMREILDGLDNDCNNLTDLQDQNIYTDSCLGDFNSDNLTSWPDLTILTNNLGSENCGNYNNSQTDWCNFTDINRDGRVDDSDSNLFIFMVSKYFGQQCICAIGPEIIDGYDNNCNGLIDEGYCGDKTCNNQETCSSCSRDCGPCNREDDDTGDDSGDDDDNGPTKRYQCSDYLDNDLDGLIDYPNDPDCTSQSDNNETDSEQLVGPENCIENWQCTAWSECINNTQTQDCTDTNNCNTTTNKPDTIRTCNKDSIPEIEYTSLFIYGVLGVTGIILIILLISIKKGRTKNE